MSSLRAATLALIIGTASADHDEGACSINPEATGPTLTIADIIGFEGSPAECRLGYWVYDDPAADIATKEAECAAYADACACEPWKCDPNTVDATDCEWVDEQAPCVVEEVSGVMTVSTALLIDGDALGAYTEIITIDLSGLGSVNQWLGIANFPNVDAIAFGELEIGDLEEEEGGLYMKDMPGVGSIEFAGNYLEEIEMEDMQSLTSVSFPNLENTEEMKFKGVPLLELIDAPRVSPREHGCFTWVSDEDATSEQLDRAYFEGMCAEAFEEDMCYNVVHGNPESHLYYPCFYESGVSIKIDGHSQLEALMAQDVNGDCGCSYEQGDCCAEHAHFESAMLCTVQNALCAVGVSPGVRIEFETGCEWESLDCGGHPDSHPETCNFAELMSRVRDALDSNDVATLAGDQTFQACQRVAEQIQDVAIAGSCP
eukprot:COSAG02_NODE_1440_length_12590_cov_2.822352_8_plen_429_part_00